MLAFCPLFWWALLLSDQYILLWAMEQQSGFGTQATVCMLHVSCIPSSFLIFCLAALALAGAQQVQSGGSAQKQLAGALGWFKNLGHSASNMVSGRSDDALEEPEYLKVKDYVAGQWRWQAPCAPAAAIAKFLTVKDFVACRECQQQGRFAFLQTNESHSCAVAAAAAVFLPLMPYNLQHVCVNGFVVLNPSALVHKSERVWARTHLVCDHGAHFNAADIFIARQIHEASLQSTKAGGGHARLLLVAWFHFLFSMCISSSYNCLLLLAWIHFLLSMSVSSANNCLLLVAWINFLFFQRAFPQQTAVCCLRLGFIFCFR